MTAHTLCSEPQHSISHLASAYSTHSHTIHTSTLALHIHTLFTHSHLLYTFTHLLYTLFTHSRLLYTFTHFFKNDQSLSLLYTFTHLFKNDQSLSLLDTFTHLFKNDQSPWQLLLPICLQPSQAVSSQRVLRPVQTEDVDTLLLDAIDANVWL